MQVHEEHELGWPYHRQVGRFLTLQDAARIDADLVVLIGRVCSIAHQPADLDKLALEMDHRHPMVQCQRSDLNTRVSNKMLGKTRSPSARFCTRLANARSISGLVPALSHSRSRPRAAAATRRLLVTSKKLPTEVAAF